MLSLVLTIVLVLLAPFCSASLPYGPNSPVITLTEKNFAETVIGSSKVTIVEFYAPWCGHCKQLTPQYEKAAENLKGLVQVAAVNCDVEKNLAAAFGIEGFPTIKVFPSEMVADPKVPNRYTKVPVPYQGERSAKALVQFGLSYLTDKHISKATEKNVDKFLEEEPTLNKVFLFTDKKKTTDLYKALSMEFLQRLKFAQVADTEKSLVEKYSVTAFPTLLVVNGNSGEATKYQGALNYDKLQTFLTEHAAPPLKNQKVPGSSVPNEKRAPEPVETVELIHITKQEEFVSKCVDKKRGLCVITFAIPADLDKEANDNQIAVLQKVVESRQNGGFRFLMVDGFKEQNFLNGFAPGADLPAIIVLSPAKKRYSRFVGAFSPESINEFLDHILKGARKTSALDTIPSLSQ